MKSHMQIVLDEANDRAMREASILRGQRDAMASDGVSWGMQEDAVEDEEEDVEEVTWQTFKGDLTEKQRKTLDKIHKHNEKLTNLKKENDAISAKDTAQGGLTQGQQTQIARNDLRMGQLLEELEIMEETLNQSIQESISGRTGVRSKKKKAFEDEDDDFSDDEFYDRASKLRPPKQKESVQSVETAETLLEKKAILTREIEKLLEAIKAEDLENLKLRQETTAIVEAGSADPLDRFMTDLSSNIVKDRTSALQNELENLTKDRERIVRLLKLADPTGEAGKNWKECTTIQGKNFAETLKKQMAGRDPNKVAPNVDKKNLSDQDVSKGKAGATGVLQVTTDNTSSLRNTPSKDDAPILPGLEPTLRLGAPVPKASDEMKSDSRNKADIEAVTFISYKDRNKLKKSNDHKNQMALEGVSRGENPAVVEKVKTTVVDVDVAGSVALLLRHKRGLDTDTGLPQDEERMIERREVAKPPAKETKRKKKQGPQQNPQMTVLEEWVPPAGQTGDGRTALNDKYGY